MKGDADTLADVFPGPSEMACRMRAHDWLSTPLGNPTSWPDGLKIPLRMLLTSRFEMWLGWGDELLFFHNDAYIPTLGIKHPTVLGKPFREVWSEVYADVAEQVEQVRRGEATWNKAMLLLLERSGYPEETYHSFSYSPLYEADGSVAGLLCVVSEDTERVISERRLDTLRQLGATLVGAEDRLSVKQAIRSTFSKNRHDFPFTLGYLYGKTDREELACTDDAVSLLCANRKQDHVGSAHVFDLAEHLDLPTGAWDCAPRQAIAVRIPAPGDRGAFGHLVFGLNPYRRDDPGIRDFADLIAAQVSGALANVETLQAERRRADRVWSHALDLMIVADADGVFRSVSPAWTRILGHPIEEVVGRNFRDFIFDEDVASTADALGRDVRNADVAGYENRYRTRDGDVRWLSWRTAMEDGLVYAYGRDVTAEKANAKALSEAEEALRQAQKMEAVGQLTGGLAHDFNNLLAGISGALELMQTRISQGRLTELDRYMAAAQSAAKRAAALTHRLLAFSRRQTLDPKRVDLDELVQGMEELVRRTVGPSIVVETLGSAGAWTVLVDPPQLENALLNLCINARDAMPDGGRITIETSNADLDVRAARKHDIVPGQYLTLSVTDTGSGMTASVIAKAFDPFFTTKPTGQGTGLGLSMIYGFAKQSGGHVRISSELGQGTAVCIYLPRHDGVVEPTSQLATSTDAPRAEQGETVLIVDDEPTVRMLVTEALEDLGYIAIEAADSVAGLKLLRSDVRIDLLVTDVGLPGGMNGRQMADAGRQMRPDLKVLFVTGYAENAAVGSEHLETGMAVMTKPFAVETLGRRIRQMIGND